MQMRMRPGRTGPWGKAQGLLRLGLSTAHAGGWLDKAPLLAGIALILLLALWSFRRRVRAVIARRVAARSTAGVGEHAAAAGQATSIVPGITAPAQGACRRHPSDS